MPSGVAILLVTKNRSIAVRTLHLCLSLNAVCAHNKIMIEFFFTEDYENNVIEEIQKHLKSDKRLIVIEYGCSADRECVKPLVEQFHEGQITVIPVPKAGVDWEMFKRKVMAESDEPTSQMGLNFDTEVIKKLPNGKWSVLKTNPRIWAMDTKQTYKRLKDKKGNIVKLPLKRAEFFDKLISSGVKITASIEHKTTCLFQHECVSNILNSHGVSVRK